MELNDQVKVTLTAYGASVLNEDNKQWKERYPKAFSSEKTDYKEGEFTKTNFGVSWEDSLIAFRLDTKYHSLIWQK